ncbi:MAG: hypothetical protein MJZ64_04515 [Paludibacteraceae bacterium]|nr:hypothetical protein [Paludibacteraceae bacterium]
MNNFLRQLGIVVLLGVNVYVQGQGNNQFQVPNADFEDWSGSTFDGHEQPAVWHYCNVDQLNIAKFNFANKQAGHSGKYCAKVEDQDLKVAGIGETSPGYFALGQPWSYVPSITKIDEATAGTYGGIDWKHRPDTMAMWIKRTGGNWKSEDFHLLYYSWSGTARSGNYKGKGGGCTSTSRTDEESDIRLATNGNECGTAQKAHQVSEGWVYGRAYYDEWTLIKVPIYYIDNTTPEKMNIICSAGNYPNFRANSGLHAGNALYVDDVQLIYSSKIQELNIDGSPWRAFDPNSSEVQIYPVDEGVTEVPQISAFRGAGNLINTRGSTIAYHGRKLQGDEITIVPGKLDEKPVEITVRAEDGSSETTYRILFMHKASSNTCLDGIQVNGKEVKNFNPYITSYVAELEYGTQGAPVVTVTKQEDKQTVDFTQPTSLNDVTTITVTAADKKTTQIYTLKYKEALLADNTLADIKVNGNSIPNYSPTKSTYNPVEIPLGTTDMPIVEAVSKYPDGMQTIIYTAPEQIDGGTYQIAVSSPGNPTPKVYKLVFKMTMSSNRQLKELFVGGNLLPDFAPDNDAYFVGLPIGTSELPEITYTAGDAFQTIAVSYPEGLDGTARVTVTAGNGTDKMVYKIVFSTQKSEISTLNGILLNGVALADFDPSKTSYEVQLPIGTTELPQIEVIKGDEYEKVTILPGGLNGTTRIMVSAGNGNTTVYQLNFSVLQATDASLQMIEIGGEPLAGFNPETLEYWFELPKGTVDLPEITFTRHDEYQTVTTRSGGLNGDYKIIVRPQSGASRTYVIHFSVFKSNNTALQMIYLNGQEMPNFQPEVTDYKDTLDISTLPTVTYLAEQGQKVMMLLDNNVQTIKVTAESGDTRVYTITFVIRKAESAFLKMIYLDGDSLKGFQPNQLTYSNIYLKGHICPKITVQKEEGQQVTILSPYGAGEASIEVSVEAGGKNTYLLQFVDTAVTPIQPIEPEPEYKESEDTSLKNILVNGVKLEGFTPDEHTYTLELEAGSQLPAVTFVKNVDKQSVVSGQTEKGVYYAYVTAENGNTASYTLTVRIAQYDNAYLKDLKVEGKSLAFEPATLSYTLSLDEGANLPEVSYKTNLGQTVLFNTVNTNEQQLIVTAESGRQNTYIISYTRAKSSNALLKDILLDGVSISDFKADKFAYIDTLALRTQVVPIVNAIGQNADQVITTYFSSVNGTTRIHVLASDGVTSADYTIEFPVRKSGNVLLNNIYLETEYAVELAFDSKQTNYEIELPHDANMSPRIIFEKGEPEQNVTYIARPIGQANEITVTAENGDTRTYSVTFIRAALEEENILSAILIKETAQSLDLTDKTQRTFDVVLPYGTRTMTVNYVKQYSEQTVLVQPGGIDKPTVLTVLSNQKGEPDAVYTLNPKVATSDPAVLTDLQVNNVTIPGFEQERFAYIVPITAAPIVRYTAAQGTTVNVLQQTGKHWQAEVSIGGRKNVYDVWYYYENDVIPNNEFTNWTTAKYNNGPKPVSWQVVADAVEKEGTYKSGGEVQQDPDGVAYLYSRYPGIFGVGGIIPGFITLGTITGKLGVAGSSTFQVNGGVPFHNTPDVLSIRYKAPTISDNNRIVYQLTGSNGLQELIHKDTEAIKDYVTLDLDLTSITKEAGTPSMMNIILNSYYQESGTIADGSAEMYVDWVRFAYNSSLAGIMVNGKETTKSGNTFTFETSDTEDRGLPQLTFVGEVEDQAQQVTWSAETVSGQYAVRTASIRNYAENGKDYTDYTLDVKRKLSTNASLDKLYINGVSYAKFDAAQTEYRFTLNEGDLLPDVYPHPAGNRQTITTKKSGNTVTITVQPEWGETKVYTLIYTYAQSDNARLAGIDGINDFAPDTYQYTYIGEALPAMNFTKADDGQTVIMDKGIFTVTAENGTQQTYTVLLQKPKSTTSGQLTELEIDGDVLADFNPGTYQYSHAISTRTSFVRQDVKDSVIYTYQKQLLTWRVIGSEEHTYSVSVPTAKSSSTTVQGIYVNGVLIENFNPQIREYTLYTDSAVELLVVGELEAQTIRISRNNGTYTIDVTAEDGTKGTYAVNVLPVVSADATLQSIMLDGQPLVGFRSDSLRYNVVIPAGAYKEHEPMVPSIDFVATDSKATVEVMTGGLNETTYLVVTSSDGTHTNNYELTFTAEPSHNAQLSAIIVNGVMVEHFEPGRSYYSVMVQKSEVVLEWRSQDKFQTVQQISKGNEYILHVTAQDGKTSRDYTVEVYEQTLSNDATLSMIWLDGCAMENFRQEINPDLYFHPGLNRYTINLPVGEDNQPDILATLKIPGQTLSMRCEGITVYIDVVAPDGETTNTYTLKFERVLSSNVNLKMIYIDLDSLAGFQPEERYYLLQTESREVPDIECATQRGQTTKIKYEVDSLHHETVATINVIAEDGVHTSDYILIFRHHLSDADTLAMIYADDVPLKGFRPQVFTYHCDTSNIVTFPVVTWDKADPGQTVKVDTLQQTELNWMGKYTVTSESGKSNAYIVSFTKILSAVNTLNMIYLNGDSLNGFAPEKTEYICSQPVGTKVLPTLGYDAGDVYQQIEVVDTAASYLSNSLGTTYVYVQAQNGDVRTYTLHYPVAYSSDTTLQMIMYNGTKIDGYDEQIMDYTIDLPSGVRQVPIITFVKQNQKQDVDVQLLDSCHVALVVTAEDREHTGTYLLTFRYYQSKNADLAAIYLNGELMPGFEPQQYEDYAFTVDSLNDVPVVTWDTAEFKQQVKMTTTYVWTPDSLVKEAIDSIFVTAEDTMETNVYVITFTVKSGIPVKPEDSDNARLAFLKLKGAMIGTNIGFDKDFDSDVLDYRIIYPTGTDPDSFYQKEDVSFATQESLAEVKDVICQVTKTALDTLDREVAVATRLTITVMAPNQSKALTYNIYQELQLDSLNRVEKLFIADSKGLCKEYDAFDKDVTYYVYTTLSFNAPNSYLEYSNSDSRFARFEFEKKGNPAVVSPDNDINYAGIEGENDSTFHLVYRAENGTRYVYKIKFRFSEINEAQKPMEGDVLIQHIPGSNQIAVASLRANVVFSLFDMNGYLVHHRRLEQGNPNNYNLITDGFGQTYFGHLTDFSYCTIISLKPGKIYLWAFTENGKRPIKSGKIVVAP